MASSFVPTMEHGLENTEVEELNDILNYLEAEHIGSGANDFNDFFKISDDINDDSNTSSPLSEEFHTLDESCLDDLLGTPKDETEINAVEIIPEENGIQEIQDILNEINDNNHHFNEPSILQLIPEDVPKPRKRGRPRKITQPPQPKRSRGRPSKGPEAAIANLEQFENVTKPSHELEKMIIREQNRAASNRYRQKQKRELEVMETEIEAETVRNKRLKVEVENLENEVAKLKKAVEDSLIMPKIIFVQNPDSLSEIVNSTILSDQGSSQTIVES